jgi:class 3 adenylate cyclase/tetratricopeptide (TPR) repeat protein
MSAAPDTVPTPQGHDGIVICLVCTWKNPVVARFCGSCGTRLLVFCWSCGTGARVGQPYCEHCGSQLAAPHAMMAAQGVARPLAEVSAAPALPTITAAPVPPLDTQAASPESSPITSADDEPPTPESGDLLVEERRVVTVVFADIVGFTTLSERLDPEDVRELSATVLGRLAEAITLYGGTIDKFMGDAVMALFGAPVAHEDDPIRAVHAALAMHQAMASLGETDRDGNALELKLRIGVNTGEVIAGTRDVGGHREYSVFGDVVNTAARLQAAARPGAILLGETTARRAGHVFELQAIDPLQLRGKQEPVPAFRVRGTLTQTGSGDSGLIEGERMPLVGRLAEVRRVRDLFNELARGRGEIAAVIGEHGVGKSRLLGETRGHAEELGLRWVEASAPSYANGLSYRLIRLLLGEVLDFPADANDAEILEAIRTGLEHVGLLKLLPSLAFVLGVELDEDEMQGLSALQQQRRGVEATRQVLHALASEHPLVVVLDALQWADPSSIDLLIDLMGLTDEAPILFLFVFTPDRDAPSWQLKEAAERSFPHRYVEIVLGPLTERAARELMCAALSCNETPAQVEDLVLERTDGNPYFIEELLRALIDAGALRRDGERWVANGDVRDLHVPDTLLATVMARIDRLPDGVRRMLQVAAVVGREFSERVLRRVLDSGSELDRELRDALRAGLIREVDVIPERRYGFTQTLIREAAAGSLLQRRRREIHVQVGWALEEIYADNLEEQYGDLARHFAEGESWERAFRYSRLAAEQAAAAYANDEAVTNFTIALESARQSAAGASPEILAILAERRGDVRALIGDYDAALSDYKSALNHHRAELDEAGSASATSGDERVHIGALAVKIARLYSYQGNVQGTADALRHAFEHLPPDSPDISSAWSLKAVTYLWKSDMEAAAEAGRKALDIAQKSGSFQHRAEAFEALTHPAMIGVIGRDIGELVHEWVRLAREQPEDRLALYKSLVAHALTHVWGMAAFDEEIRADVTEAIELARATGSVAGENTARGILGIGLFMLGEWQQAEIELRRGAGQTTTIAGVDSICEWWLMLLLTLRGELESSAAQMREWLADQKNTHRKIVMNGLLALNRHLAGDVPAAESALAAADEAVRALGCRHCLLTYETFAAEILAETAPTETVSGLIDTVRELGAAYGRDIALLAADRAEAVLDLRDGRPDDAVRLLEGALEHARQVGQPYEVARTARGLGRAYLALGGPGDDGRGRAALDEALATFVRLGAEPDARSVRSMLEQPLPA